MSAVKGMNCYVGVANSAGQLKVAVGNGARGVVEGDNLLLDSEWKWLAPDDGRMVGFMLRGMGWREPDAAHAGLGGINGPNE